MSSYMAVTHLCTHMLKYAKQNKPFSRICLMLLTENNRRLPYRLFQLIEIFFLLKLIYLFMEIKVGSKKRNCKEDKIEG